MIVITTSHSYQYWKRIPDIYKQTEEVAHNLSEFEHVTYLDYSNEFHDNKWLADSHYLDKQWSNKISKKLKNHIYRINNWLDF